MRKAAQGLFTKQRDKKLKEGGAGSPYKTKDKRVVTGNKTGNDQIIK